MKKAGNLHIWTSEKPKGEEEFGQSLLWLAGLASRKGDSGRRRGVGRGVVACGGMGGWEGDVCGVGGCEGG